MNEPNTTLAMKTNVSFSEIYSCDKTLCHIFKNSSILPFTGRRPFEENWEYKVLIDIEGFAWSLRLKNLLYSNSVVFKPIPIFREFWQDLLKPWVHYIPVKFDFSDVEEKLDQVLSGNNSYLSVIQASTDFIKDHLRIEDAHCYAYKLLLEYSKLMKYNMKPSKDRELK